jgi:hypothetical protein
MGFKETKAGKDFSAVNAQTPGLYISEQTYAYTPEDGYAASRTITYPGARGGEDTTGRGYDFKTGELRTSTQFAGQSLNEVSPPDANVSKLGEADRNVQKEAAQLYQKATQLAPGVMQEEFKFNKSGKVTEAARHQEKPDGYMSVHSYLFEQGMVVADDFHPDPRGGRHPNIQDRTTWKINSAPPDLQREAVELQRKGAECLVNAAIAGKPAVTAPDNKPAAKQAPTVPPPAPPVAF